MLVNGLEDVDGGELGAELGEALPPLPVLPPSWLPMADGADCEGAMSEPPLMSARSVCATRAASAFLR